MHALPDPHSNPPVGAPPAELRFILDSLSMGVVCMDADSRIVSANRAFAKIFVVDPAELPGCSMTEFMPEATVKVHLAAVARYLRSGRRSIPWDGIVLQAQARNGEARSVRVIFAEFEAEGQRRFTAVIEDLTDQASAMRNNERREVVLRGLFENSPDAVLLLESGGRILDSNRRATEIFCCPREGLERRDLSGWLPRQTVEAIIGTEAAEAGPRRFEGHLPSAESGEPIHVEFLSVALDDGPFRLIHLAIRDLTQQDRHREAEMQSQKMAAIGRLCGGVAHDFNNMLTVILGHGEELVNLCPPGTALNEQAQELLAAARSAAGLTRRLLNISRKSKLGMVRTDPDQTIVGMAAMLDRLIGEHITMELNLGAGEAAIVAEQGLLELVLLNLTVNARDAMSGRGIIIITTDILYAEEAQAAGLPGIAWFRMRLRDTGCGMDAVTQQHIFEPFFTTKPEGAGTGLGLATVYTGVRKAGGAISVESRLNEGACFTVLLPLGSSQTPD